MLLTQIIDIIKMLKLTHGQGHKVKGQICNYTKNGFGYKSWTGVWILILLTHMNNVNE